MAIQVSLDPDKIHVEIFLGLPNNELGMKAKGFMAKSDFTYITELMSRKYESSELFLRSVQIVLYDSNIIAVKTDGEIIHPNSFVALHTRLSHLGGIKAKVEEPEKETEIESDASSA